MLMLMLNCGYINRFTFYGDKKSNSSAPKNMTRCTASTLPHQIISHPEHTHTQTHIGRSGLFQFLRVCVCALLFGMCHWRCVMMHFHHSPLHLFLPLCLFHSCSPIFFWCFFMFFRLFVRQFGICHRLSKSIHSDNFALHSFSSPFISFICSMMMLMLLLFGVVTGEEKKTVCNASTHTHENMTNFSPQSLLLNSTHTGLMPRSVREMWAFNPVISNR